MFMFIAVNNLPIMNYS